MSLVLDPLAGEPGLYDRLLAHIKVDREDFSSQPLRQGLARVYTWTVAR